MFLPDFSQIWILSTDSHKSPQCQISLNPVLLEPRLAYTCGQKDMRKLTVAFCNFANAPKNEYSAMDQPFSLKRHVPQVTWDHFQAPTTNAPWHKLYLANAYFTFAMIKLRIAFQLKLSSIPMTDSNTAKQMRIRLRSMMLPLVFCQSFRSATAN
jgi:hypothetical protein